MKKNLLQRTGRQLGLGRRGVMGISVFISMAFAFTGEATADQIYLKGRTERVIEGVIDDSRSDEQRVFIRTESGLIPITRDRIERIERRENISPREREGDLLAQRGDLQQALDAYLDAHEEFPEEEALENKIAELRARIQEENDRRYRRDFELADSEVAARDFEAAVQRIETLIEEAPNEAAETRLREKLSEIYIEQARHLQNMVAYSEAEAAFRKAIDVFDEGAIARFELAATIAASPAKRDEALRLYEKGLEAIERDPTLIETADLLRYQFEFAQLQAKQGNHRRAAELFWKVVQDDEQGRFTEASNLLVSSLMSIQNDLIGPDKDNDEAVAMLEDVLKNYPQHADANYLVGRIFCEEQNWAKALPHLETAVNQLVGSRTAVQQVMARSCLAKGYRQQNQNDRAISQLEAILQIQPTRYDTLSDLGEIYMEQKNLSRAANYFLEAIEADDSQERAYVGAGRALRMLERNRDAAEHYEKLIKLNSDELMYYFEYGLVRAALNEHDEAQRMFRKVITLAGERPEGDPEVRDVLPKVYTRLGETNIAQRNYYEAIESFDKALEVNGTMADALAGKGAAFRELNELDRAEEFFKQAIEMDPENPEHHLSLGVFYHKFRKDGNAALPYYMSYYEKGGNDPQVREWIRELGGTPPRVTSS